MLFRIPIPGISFKPNLENHCQKHAWPAPTPRDRSIKITHDNNTFTPETVLASPGIRAQGGVWVKKRGGKWVPCWAVVWCEGS